MRRYPVNGQIIVTNTYRADKYNPHYGEDLAVPKRTALFAMTDGIITEARTSETRQWIANTSGDPFKPIGFPIIKRSLKNEDYGNYILIDHGNNVKTRYAHLDSVEVFIGQSVKEGELIGYADSTGNSTGNHVHFEIIVNNRVINPSKFDFSFKGTGGLDGSFHAYDGVIAIRKDVGLLNVRKRPATTAELSGSKELKGGTEGVKVKGFVEGEEISYNLNGEVVKTNLWWVSQFGNFFWAGGTVPTAQQVLFKEKGIKMTPEDVAKLDQDIVNSEKRIEELTEALNALKAQRANAVVAEPVVEETTTVVSEPTETVEEPKVENVEVNLGKEEGKNLIKDIMEKFGINRDEL